MKITQEAEVTLTYRLLDVDGKEVESSGDEPVTYRHGQGELLEGLEKALEGAESGQALTIRLGPQDAYGDYDPEGIFMVPRKEFPEDVELVPGDWIVIQVESEGVPEELDARIVEEAEDEVVLDANHPLAGKDVTFEVQVISVSA